MRRGNASGAPQRLIKLHAVRGHQMTSTELTRVLTALPFLKYFGHTLPKPLIMNSYYGEDLFPAIAVSMGRQNLVAPLLLPWLGALSDALGREPCLVAGRVPHMARRRSSSKARGVAPLRAQWALCCVLAECADLLK